MKINEPNRVGAVNRYKSQNDAKAELTGGKKAKQKDEVHISAEALELQNTQGATPAKKLEELKQAISSGTYHVDAGKIAEKLLPYLK